MSDVKLTVVMAVRDGHAYLREAVESVLTQSVSDFEFLIVDDASTDDTPEILSSYCRDRRLRVLRNPANLGLTQSLNRALSHARADVIARHDADDVSPSDRFAVQLEALRNKQDTSLVTGRVATFGGESKSSDTLIFPPAWQPRLEWELLFGNVVGAGAHVMFPRRIMGTAVLYPTQFRYAQDYALWCRLCRLGSVACPPQVVYRHRQHQSSISVRSRHEQDECARGIRHAYQSRFLRHPPSADATSELSRFWTTQGPAPEKTVWGRVYSQVIDLRDRFLVYVDYRYGRNDRRRLELEIEREIGDRLAHWLFRASRGLDVRACRDLLSIIESRGQLRDISTRALAKAARALIAKLPQPDATVASSTRRPELAVEPSSIALK